MIARVWHGRVPKEKAGEYLRLMREVALPDYKSVSGNAGAYVLQREERQVVLFTMLTFWDSEEAIRAFAGKEIARAKYYDFDKDFLLEMDAEVEHYQVFDR